MAGLPPLTLSSGPSISGGNPVSGGASDGAFTVSTGGGATWQTNLAKYLPLAAALVVVVLMVRAKRR